MSKVKKTKLTKLLHSKNPKLCSTKTQSDLCNFIRNLNPNCDSSEWKREFSKTLSSLIFNNILEVLSGGKTSQQKKSFEIILKKITDVVGGPESNPETSPESFARAVQTFIANVLSPWLGKSVTDICGKASRKNHDLEITRHDDDFPVNEPNIFQRKHDSMKTSMKTKDDKMKSTEKARNNYKRNIRVKSHFNIGTRRKIVVGQSDDVATVEEIERDVANAKKHGFDIEKKYSKKNSGLIHLDDGKVGGKSKTTRKPRVDHELEKGSVVRKVDEEKVSLKKVVEKRKIKSSSGTNYPTVSEGTTGKRLVKNLKIKNEKITSKSRGKATAESKITGRRTSNANESVPKRMKTTKLRGTDDANTKTPYRTVVLEESGGFDADVNVKVKIGSKTDADRRPPIVRKYGADTAKLVKNSKTGRKNVKAVKKGDKGPLKTLKLKKNSKNNRNGKKSVVSRSQQDIQLVGTENENGAVNGFPAENDSRFDGEHYFSDENLQQNIREEEQWFSGEEHDVWSSPLVERPEGWYFESSVEEEWSQNDGLVTGPDRTFRDKPIKHYGKNESYSDATVGGPGGGPETNFDEQNETTPRSRERGVSHTNIGGVGYTSGGPQKNDHYSQRTKKLQDAEQVNADGVGYTSGVSQKDNHHSQQMKISRDAEQVNTDGVGYTSGASQKDEHHSQRKKESRDVYQTNTVGAGYTSDRPQEDDYRSRQLRGSRDIDQTNKVGVDYASDRPQEDDYRSRQLRGSREIDQKNKVGADYASDRPQEDDYRSRQLRGSRDIDQTNKVGANYAADGPQKDNNHSQRSKSSRDADQTIIAGGINHTSDRPRKGIDYLQRLSGSQDADQTITVGSDYISDEPRKDNDYSRRSKRSRDADQAITAGDIGYTSDGPRRDIDHSRRLSGSQDADQVYVGGAGYISYESLSDNSYRSVNSTDDSNWHDHIDDCRRIHEEKSVCDVVSLTKLNIEDEINEFLNRITSINNKTCAHNIGSEIFTKNCANMFANKTQSLTVDENRRLLPPCHERTFTVCPEERAKRIVKKNSKLEPDFFEDFDKCCTIKHNYKC